MNLFCFRYYEFVGFLFNKFPTLFLLVIQKVWGMFFLTRNPLKRNCKRKICDIQVKKVRKKKTNNLHKIQRLRNKFPCFGSLDLQPAF